MKTLKFTAILLFLSLMACKNQDKKVEVEEPSTTYNIEIAKTYAEISIKEGGHWEGREYIEAPRWADIGIVIVMLIFFYNVVATFIKGKWSGIINFG